MSRYKFFQFNTSEKMASNKGIVSGYVDTNTGIIEVTQTWGTMGYNEQYKYNIADKINSFPFTTKDFILLQVKKLLADE